MAVVSCASTAMSRAALLSETSISPVGGWACSSSSSGPFFSAVCLKNGDAARSGTATLSSGFVGSRRKITNHRSSWRSEELGFVKLGQVDEKRRRWGAILLASASLGADVAAVVAENEEVAEKSEEKELIGKILSLVEGSDRGVRLGKEEHTKVGELVGELEQYCIPEPLQSPILNGEWDVVYASNPVSTGGGYRTWIGRLIFITREMGQVNGPGVILNFVRFSLFGLIPGEVKLQGKVERLDQKLFKIDFEPPFFQLGPIKFQYGKTSSVTLAIIYLDDKFRIGRGVRGTVFVFTRR